MIKFKNINGDVFLAVGSIKRKSALNGEKSLSATITQGDDVLNKIDKGWSLEFANELYVVTYFERNDNDNTVEIDAIHKFFWDMTKSVLYNSYSNSHVARFYLDEIFKDTGYTYALNFDPKAFEKENWGMKNKLSLFNDAISTMGAEFEINGTLVSIFKNVGSDLSTIVRHGFNLSDMTLENDNANFATYAEGFGAYEDQENQKGPRLHVTYTSSLAKTFGKLHAEPIDDQRYTVKDSLLQAVKDKVDSSFAVSIKLSLYDLTAAGYPYEMANVGDWLLAVDENLDFKQKIRIISVDDEFAEDGTRISYTVTCGDIGVTKKYQDANATLTQKVQSAYDNAQAAKESAIQAVISSTGKNTNYWFDSVDEMNAFQGNEGDLAFVQTGDGQAMYVYTKMPDGSFKWVKRLDPDTGEQIAAGVEEAIATANKHTDELNEKQASEAAVFQSEANARLSSADVERHQFSSAATSMANSASAHADSVANSASAYGKAQAASALNNANKALDKAKTDLTTAISQETTDRTKAVQDVNSQAQKYVEQAKTDLTTSINKEVTDRNRAVSAANSQAQGYAAQAKSDAIEAAKTADGQVRKDFKETTDSLSSSITQNKKDADGKISTAQTTATQALDGLNTKVSQTDFDEKTGKLTTDLTTTSQTANQAKLDIASIKSEADSQSAQINDIVSDAKGTKQTISDIKTEQGKQSGSINQLETRADGFDAKIQSISDSVNAEGQVNQLMNTEFNPDLEGWTLSAGDGSRTPFKSSFNSTVQANIVGFNTLDSTENTYAVLRQDITIGSATGGYVSLSWQAYAQTFANYANLWVMFYDIDGNKLDQQFKEWTPQKANGSTTGAWNRQKFEGVAIPAKTVKISVQFQAREGMLAYVARPMLVFDKTIGSYVQGNYNNNGALAKVKLTAEQASLDLSTYKTSADGKISKAQSDISANAKAIATKVSQSDYNAKTNNLTTKVNTVTQTANETKNELADISKTVDTQNTKINTISNTVTGTNQTIADIQTEQGKQSGSINKLETRADGFDAKIQSINDAVNADGQINQLVNTEFSPDLEGWDTSDTNATSSPAYVSSVVATYGSRSIGFNTKNASANTYSRLRQNIFLTRPNNVVVSFSWRSYGTQVDNYNNLFIRFYDSSNNLVDYTSRTWATATSRWEVHKIENIAVPAATARVQISFEAREGTLAYVLQPMLVFDDHVGTYVQGNYNNNAKVAEVKLTADKATLDLKNYKTSNDGRISSAESNITAAKNELAGKVSQSDFNAKTNDLTTKYGQVKLATDSVTTDVANYKKSNDGRIATDEANITANSKAIGLKVSQTDFDKRTKDVDSKFANQQITVDSIKNTVSELQAKANAQGQINQLLNTEFTPDLENWDTSETNATSSPAYVSSVVAGYGSRSVGFNTKNSAAKSYSRFRQNIAVTRPNNVVISFSWRAYSTQVDNYNNLFIRFYDSSNNLVDYASRTWATATSRWELQKIENIAIPATTATIQISFEAREGTLAYVLQPMLVFGEVVGDYVAGNYNNNNRVAATELAIDSITSLVKDPNKGLSATWNLASDGQTIAVQAQKDATNAITTAKGLQTTINDNKNDLQTQMTATAKQVTTEIQDRKNGDSSVRTDLASLIDQRVNDTKSGYESYFSQKAQGIVAGLSMPNRLFNTEFTPDLEGWTVSNLLSGTGKPARIYASSGYGSSNGLRINAYSDNSADADAYYQISQDVKVPNNITVASLHLMGLIYAISDNVNAYVNASVDAINSSGQNIGAVVTGGTLLDKNSINSWQESNLRFTNMAIPTGTAYLRINIYARGQTSVNISQPMLVFKSTISDTYMPGSYSGMNTSTVLQLFKDNWGIGLADNIGKITSGIIGDKNSLNLINNNIVMQGNTTVTADFYAKGGNFKNLNASNITTGTINAAKINVINLDVSSLSGNIANFITGNINTLNSHLLYGDTGHLTTVDTGLIINRQDNHLQLSANGLYDVATKRAQLELLNYDSGIDANMQGSLNYYKNPHNKGTGLGIRFFGNQILAIDEAEASGNLYLSAYASGQVQIVNRDRNGFQDIKASKFVTSSERKYKSEINEFNDDALELVNGLNIRRYIKNNENEIGVIADEADERILDKTNTGVDLYSFVSVVAKAVQELSGRVKELRNERTSN